MTTAMIFATLTSLALCFFAPMLAPTGGGDYDLSGMFNCLIGWIAGLITIVIFTFIGVWWAMLIFPPIVAYVAPTVIMRL